MESIKIQKNYEKYFILCFGIVFLIVIFQMIDHRNMSNLWAVILMSGGFVFYFMDRKRRRKQLDYFIQCCDDIVDQKDFQVIDGEAKECLLSHKLFTLSKRYHQTLDTIHQEQSKLKDYIEDISHQLKTPMTAIRINTELLLDEQNDKRLTSIYYQIKRIQNLVNDLQTIALIDSHNIIFDFQKYELEDMIDDIQEDLSYLNPSIKLNHNISLLCDYRWMIEALENIIKNCLETSQSAIYIDVKDSESTYNIIIQDEGTGFKEEDLKQLFQRFYRGKDSQGTGLGLYIAREIIEAHHGLIHAYNKEGACFEMVLPKLNVKKKL